MYTLVLAIHVVLAVALVGLVLLQQGKGADAGAIISGGGANTIFGVGGASSALIRATTGIAVLFMLTSVLLVKLSASGSGRGGKADVLDGMDVSGLAPETPAAAQTSAGVIPTAAPQQAEAPKAAQVPAAAVVVETVAPSAKKEGGKTVSAK